MSFRNRLRALEREDGGGEFLIIYFQGGFSGYEESLEQQRAKIDRARAEGKRFVCLGGIGPDRE